MAVDVSPHFLSPLAGKLPCGLFSSSMTRTGFWYHRSLTAYLHCSQTPMKDSVDGCGIRYHRCLGQRCIKLVPMKSGLFVTWLSCLAQGFRASLKFGQQPPLGLQQQVSLSPLLGLSCGLWLLRVAARMGAGTLELQFCYGSCQSLVNHVGVESCWALSCGESPL